MLRIIRIIRLIRIVKLYKNAVLARTNIELKRKEKERMKAYQAAMEHSSSSSESAISKIIENKPENYNDVEPGNFQPIPARNLDEDPDNGNALVQVNIVQKPTALMISSLPTSKYSSLNN